MFDSRENSSFIKHTLTVALLLMALVFSPAIWLVSERSLFSISLAIAGSAVCICGAWLNWRRYSHPTIAASRRQAKLQ